MTDYQLHVIACIKRFNRLHICPQFGAGIDLAVTEALRRVKFDWWVAAPRNYLQYNYTDLPDNATTFTSTELASEITSGSSFLPRGLILNNLPISANILTLVDGMKQVYGKNETKIVTIGPTILLGDI